MFIIEHNLGYGTTAETGFLAHRDPDVLLAPDYAFYAYDKLPDGMPASFIPVPPDFAIEVISPANSAMEMMIKVSHYLEVGVRLVWIIFPQQEKVVVHEPGTGAITLGSNDTLTGGDVLPGFRLDLARIFLSK
jgi:Uma2 family endonuclease